jgi:hypothetical protein
MPRTPPSRAGPLRASRNDQCWSGGIRASGCFDELDRLGSSCRTSVGCSVTGGRQSARLVCGGAVAEPVGAASDRSCSGWPRRTSAAALMAAMPRLRPPRSGCSCLANCLTLALTSSAVGASWSSNPRSRRASPTSSGCLSSDLSLMRPRRLRDSDFNLWSRSPDDFGATGHFSRISPAHNSWSRSQRTRQTLGISITELAVVASPRHTEVPPNVRRGERPSRQRPCEPRRLTTTRLSDDHDRHDQHA